MKINFSALQQIYYLSCSLVLYSQHSTFADEPSNKNAQKEYSYLSVKKWQPTVTFGGKYGNLKTHRSTCFTFATIAKRHQPSIFGFSFYG